MTFRVNILKHSMLMALMIFFISDAMGQEIYYSEGVSQFRRAESEEIETSSDGIILSWTTERRFAGPWTVMVRENGELKDSTEVEIAAYEVDMRRVSDVEVEIMSCDLKSTISVRVTHETNYWWVLYLILLIGIIVLGTYLFILYAKRKREKMEREAETPAPRHTRKYESATVLFSDIQGFTKIAEHMNPEQLVDELDKYFIYFDELVDRYNVEKIKTIGDAYMCAGGVPDLDSANPIEVALVGLGMIDYVKERQTKAGAFWNMRVGIHTGPLVSAALGNKKKSFDIWGDSVNTASRMESSGVPGEVNVSGDTYMKISEYFECEHRGRMPVKYKGEIDMYFVKRLKPEYAEQGSTCRPNKVLIQRIQAMKVDDVLAEYSERLKSEELPYFVSRLEMLMMQCEMLCYAEGMTVRDSMIAKLLLLYGYANNECPKEMKLEMNDLVKRLRKMNFEDEEIEDMQKLLLRGVQGKKPETHIEEVVYDTYNMMYGRMDFAKQIKVLYECSSTSGRHFSKKDWLKQQDKMLNELTYYTVSARELAEVPVVKQKEILEQIIRLF